MTLFATTAHMKLMILIIAQALLDAQHVSIRMDELLLMGYDRMGLSSKPIPILSMCLTPETMEATSSKTSLYEVPVQ